MADETTIGTVTAGFIANAESFLATVHNIGAGLQKAGSQAKEASGAISATGEQIDKTAALQERAAERARRAWQREVLQQNLAADAQKEAGRAAELTALKADILARSVGAAGNAAGHSVPQWSAASGAIRVLEGGMNNNVRAAERFLSTTLGLGPVLSAAFPVVGAIAMVGVLSEMISRVTKFGSDAIALSNELGIGWLDGAIAQMDGFAKSVKQSDDHILSLERDMDQLDTRAQKRNIESTRLTQGDAAADRVEAAQRQSYINHQVPMQAADLQRRKELESFLKAGPQMVTDPKSGIIAPASDWAEKSAHSRVELKELNASISDRQKRISDAEGNIAILHVQESQAAQRAQKTIPVAADTALRDSEISARVRPPTLEEAKRQQYWSFLKGRPNKQFTGKYFKDAQAHQEEIDDMGEPAPLDRGYGPVAPALLSAQAQGSVIAAQNARAFAEERDKIAVATGALSAHQAALNKAADDAQAFREKMAALGLQLAALTKYDSFYSQFSITNPNLAAAQRVRNEMGKTQGQSDISQLQDAAVSRSTSSLTQFSDSLMRLSQQFTNTGEQLSSVFVAGLRQFNATLINELSTPANMLRGKHVWGNMGASFARTVGSTALEHGEGLAIQGASRLPGAIGKLFGGMSARGSKGNPMFVTWDSTPAAAGSSSGSASSMIGSIISGAAESGKGGMMSGALGAVGPLLGALPHFALGGEIPSNMPSLVGERGPEVFMPSTAGRIIPHDRVGGNVTHIHVDARGSNDPAAMTAAAQRVFASHLPYMGKFIDAHMADQKKRSPRR